jgi:hypothetical protein
MTLADGDIRETSYVEPRRAHVISRQGEKYAERCVSRMT